MLRNPRFLIACFVTAAAAGCGKGASDAPASGSPATTTAAPAPPPPTAAAPAPAPAEVAYRWEIHKATNLKFEVPTTWTLTPNGNVLVAKTPTPGVGIEFVAATGGVEAKNDEKVMLAAVARTLQGARFTSKMKPAQQHGLKGFVATGTGKKDGAEVEWFTSAIGDGKGHAMLTLGMYAPTVSPAYKAQMIHILDSIQPAS